MHNRQGPAREGKRYLRPAGCDSKRNRSRYELSKLRQNPRTHTAPTRYSSPLPATGFGHVDRSHAMVGSNPGAHAAPRPTRPPEYPQPTFASMIRDRRSKFKSGVRPGFPNKVPDEARWAVMAPGRRASRAGFDLRPRGDRAPFALEATTSRPIIVMRVPRPCAAQTSAWPGAGVSLQDCRGAALAVRSGRAPGPGSPAGRPAPSPARHRRAQAG